MKSVLGLVVAMMLVAPGCGDDTTSTSADLSVGTPADLSVKVSPDMTVAKATTCAGALMCVTSSCLTAANQQACALDCESALTGQAKTDFTALFGCVVAVASVAVDGGTKIDPIAAAKSIAAGGACVGQATECKTPVGLDK